MDPAAPLALHEPSPTDVVPAPTGPRFSPAEVERLAPPVAPAFDEWRGTAGGGGPPAAHWSTFFELLGPQGWSMGEALESRVRQRIEDDGATYTIYDALREPHPWPLQRLPYIVSPEDWRALADGVQQRARMLEAAMVDLYGPQRLLREAVLPASLVFAHPHFLRPVHGIRPPGGSWLRVVAFDVKRGEDGKFRVVAQRLQAPSGMGYMLENRLVIGNVFQPQFAALRVQRLAAGFRRFVDGLRRGSLGGESARIAMLTPGPWNETYFEQAFLARYLGIGLAEGSDLTVRGQQLFLKTMHGLERVHVLLRRVDDAFVDPLELNAGSALGVPGLLQAVRAGQVVVANMPGVGVLESPGLAAFWPGVCARLLGEPLKMHAATSWWCGEASVWKQQRQRLAQYIVAPTFPDAGFTTFAAGDLNAAEREALRANIDADPASFTLQAPLVLSQTPVWQDDALVPRGVVLRVFAVRGADGQWDVLPGGMARVAASGRLKRGQDPWLSMQQGSSSADTWVIASGEVDASSMRPAPLAPSQLKSWHRSVTSRAAESLFWLGRYCERAEQCVQLLRVALEALPAARTATRALIADLARWQDLAPPLPPEGTWVDDSAAALTQQLMHALRGAVEAMGAPGAGFPQGGLAHNLRQLRHCAQTVHERLTPEHWGFIQQVCDDFAQPADAAPSDWAGAFDDAMESARARLARTAMQLAAIAGAQADRMVRDDGWRLLAVGRHLERIDQEAHALERTLLHRVQGSDDGIAFLLKLTDSLTTYRAQFQSRTELLPLVHLLVVDADNPRSLAWMARTLREDFLKLARHDGLWAERVVENLPQPAGWDLATLVDPSATDAQPRLMDALQRLRQAVQELGEQIDLKLFAHVAAPERRVWQ